MKPVTKISLFGLRLGLIALVGYWLALFTGTHLPKVPDVLPILNDKSKHFIGYFGLTILLCYVGTSSNLVPRFGRVAVIALAYGIFDELTQSFVPGRFTEFYDFVADACGIACAITVYATLRKFFRKQQAEA